MSLFNDDDDVQLTVNPRFAAQYESKKKAEELTNLSEKYRDVEERQLKKISELRRKYGTNADITAVLDDDDRSGGSDDEDDSDSEEEDENGELVTPDVDAQILKTLALIRKRDPAVYQADRQFFDEEELTKAQVEWKRKQEELKKRKKKVTLKDLERAQVLLGITDVAAAEEDELNAIKQSGGRTHVEEQAALKDAFKAAIADADAADNDDEDLFTQRVKTDAELAAEEEEYRNFLLESMAAVGGEGYFADWHDRAGSTDMSENDKFLMEYILNRGWIDKDDKKAGAADLLGGPRDALHPVEAGIDLDADDELLDKQDGFEREYNFRFEEAAALDGDVAIKTFARDVPDSVRRKDDKRKRAREAKKERKDKERKQKEEELKRLKNLKRDEIMAKLREIAEITGNDQVGFDEVDLDAEFDPDQWDQKMQTVFNDEFYNQADDDVKPEWDDDIDISDLVGAEPERAPAPLAAPAPHVDAEEAPAPAADKKKKKKKKRKHGSDSDDDDVIYVPDADAMDVDPAPAAPVSSKAKAAADAHAAEQAKAKAEQLDELYKLDYEDIVGGIPVRFHYRQVRPANYGLDVEDILEADETELNQYVSLKKLAPYRPPEKEERDLKKIMSNKQRLREFKKQLAERKKGHGGVQGGRGERVEKDEDADAQRRNAYLPTSKKGKNKKPRHA
ncbi:KRRI-Interacting protein 1 [Allomyces javanicus]|nr:KRRI-Interacting protein 1 [Allomyces javanicus]